MPKIMKNGIEYGGGGEIYEEGEHKIGTFLGKDLYRRVFKVNVNMPNAQLVTYDPQFTVTGYATSIRGICYLSALNTYVTSDSYPAISMSYNGDHVFTLFQNATSGSFACKAIVIEYTKEKWN